MAVIIEWANGTKSKIVPNMSAAKAFIAGIEERPIEIYNRETGEFTKIEDSMKRKIKDDILHWEKDTTRPYPDGTSLQFLLKQGGGYHIHRKLSKEGKPIAYYVKPYPETAPKGVLLPAFYQKTFKTEEALVSFLNSEKKRMADKKKIKDDLVKPESIEKHVLDMILSLNPKMKVIGRDKKRGIVVVSLPSGKHHQYKIIDSVQKKIKDFDSKLISLIRQMKADKIPNHQIAMNLEKRFDADEVRKALSSFKDSKYKITISNKNGKTIKTKITDSAKEALKIKHRITDSKHGLKVKVTKIKDTMLIKSFEYKGRKIDVVKDGDAFAWWVYKGGERLYADDGFSSPNEAIAGAKTSIDKRIAQGYKDGCHKTHDADIRHLTRKDFIAKYNAGVFKGKLKPEDMQRGKWVGTYKSGESVTIEFKDSKKHKIKDDDSYGGKYYLKLVTSNGGNKVYTMDTEESAINWAKEMGAKGKKVTVSKGLHGTVIYKTRDSKIKDWSKDIVRALVKKGYNSRDIAMKLVDPSLDDGNTFTKEKLAISAYAQELINAKLKRTQENRPK